MRNNLSYLLFLAFFLCLFFSISQAEAASLFLSPETGVYYVDSTFPVKIMVDSGEDSINAADAVLSFHPAHLEVIDVSEDSSIFSFWTTEPSFSNARGIIEFAGGNSKSFIGPSGNIITITFKVIAAAQTEIRFSTGSILAADGKATNILVDMRGAIYNLQPKNTIPSSEKGQSPIVIAEGAPQTPYVFSESHPSEGEWYADNNPVFAWEVPPDIVAERLQVDQKPYTIPVNAYPSSINKKGYENMPDGIWYFHLRFSNNYGWGEVVHKRVLIDTQPPQSFIISIDNAGDPTNPSPIIYFESLDNLSGINYYEVKINEKESIIIERPYYQLPPHGPGNYTLIVKAIDKAKNSTTQTANFKIEPVAAPVITIYPKTDRVGEALSISGRSNFPEASISVFIKQEGGEVDERQVNTDSQGNWSFIYDKRLEEGIYQVWVKITDTRGAESNPSEKITVIVTQPLFIRVGRVAISYLTVILTLGGMVLILVTGVLYIRNKVREWRGRLKKETKDITQSVVKGFSLLEKEIQDQIEYFDKKPGLSDSEKEVYEKLKRALNKSKDIIGKEIKDVEKELE